MKVGIISPLNGRLHNTKNQVSNQHATKRRKGRLCLSRHVKDRVAMTIYSNRANKKGRSRQRAEITHTHTHVCVCVRCRNSYNDLLHEKKTSDKKL